MTLFDIFGDLRASTNRSFSSSISIRTIGRFPRSNFTDVSFPHAPGKYGELLIQLPMDLRFEIETKGLLFSHFEGEVKKRDGASFFEQLRISRHRAMSNEHFGF